MIGEHVLRQLVVGWLCEGALPFELSGVPGHLLYIFEKSCRS